MKKLLTFLMIGLIATVFVLGCGTEEKPEVETPEEAVETVVDEVADTVETVVDSLVEEAKEAVDDAADEVKDAVEGATGH